MTTLTLLALPVGGLANNLPSKPTNPKYAEHFVQVCAAELAAAKFMAMRKAENNSLLCPVSPIHFAPYSLNCQLQPMSNCKYRGWACTLNYWCSPPPVVDAPPRRRKWKYADKELPYYFKAEPASQPKTIKAQTYASCSQLSARSAQCLPFVCKQSMNTLNATQQVQFQIYGRKEGVGCQMGQYETSGKTTTLRTCRFPDTELSNISTFFKAVTSPTTDKNRTRRLIDGNIVAIVDHREILNPMDNSSFCKKYYYYRDKDLCQRSIQNGGGRNEEISCDYLRGTINSLSSRK